MCETPFSYLPRSKIVRFVVVTVGIKHFERVFFLQIVVLSDSWSVRNVTANDAVDGFLL